LQIYLKFSDTDTVRLVCMNKHVSKFTLVGISVPVPTHSVCISDIDYTNIGITISVLPKNEEVFKFGRKKWF